MLRSFILGRVNSVLGYALMLNTKHFIIINNNNNNNLLLLFFFFSVREQAEHILQSDRSRERAEFSHVSSLSGNPLDDLC